MSSQLLTELAALIATALAAVGALPQLRQLLATGDTTGVSMAAAAFGLVNELVWTGYSIHVSLWSAVPETVLLSVSNLALVVVLHRARPALGRPTAVVATWAAVMATVAALGGAAAALALAYAVQVAPAIWSAYRTTASGVAVATWAVLGVESVLWGIYGWSHGDPATSGFAVTGTAASLLMLARKRSVARAICQPEPARTTAPVKLVALGTGVDDQLAIAA